MNFPSNEIKQCSCGVVPMHYILNTQSKTFSIKCKCGNSTKEYEHSEDAINNWNKKVRHDGPLEKISQNIL